MNSRNRRLIPILLTGVLAAGLAGPARAASGTPGEVQAIHDLRSVGTAMWTWYKDEQAPRRSPSAHQSAEEAQDAVSTNVDEIPVISREELAKLLVPKYIVSIPDKDPWGRPYEYRLNTQDPNAIHVMAVRTSGKDGAFSGTTYEVGEYTPADEGQDMVWQDGFFVRWPAPAKK